MRVQLPWRRPGGPLLRHPDEEGLSRDRDPGARAQPRRRHLRLGRGLLGRDAGELRGGRRRRATPRSPRSFALLGRHRDHCRRHERGLAPATASAALARKQLLAILQRALPRARRRAPLRARGRPRCRASPTPTWWWPPTASTASSATSSREHFQPTLDWRRCKFTWLGTDKPLDAFTFIFRENEHGLFQVHAYPFAGGAQPPGSSSATRRPGAAPASTSATEAETVALLRASSSPTTSTATRCSTNRSIWRTLPDRHDASAGTTRTSCCSATRRTPRTSRSARAPSSPWRTRSRCVDAFGAHGTDDVPAVLAAYEEARWVDVLKLQKAAQTSLEWFEHSARYLRAAPAAASPST